MNNLTAEEEINYIATDILAKVFFPWCYSSPASAAFTCGSSNALFLNQHLPAEFPTFFFLFFVSALLILKSMNNSQRIPYLFKAFC